MTNQEKVETNLYMDRIYIYQPIWMDFPPYILIFNFSPFPFIYIFYEQIIQLISVLKGRFQLKITITVAVIRQ